MKRFAMIVGIIFLSTMLLAPMALSFEVAETKSQNGQTSRSTNLAPLNPGLAQQYPHAAAAQTGGTYNGPASTASSREIATPSSDAIRIPLSKGQKSLPREMVKNHRSVTYENGVAVVEKTNFSESYRNAHQALYKMRRNFAAMKKERDALKAENGQLRNENVRISKANANLTAENKELWTANKDFDAKNKALKAANEKFDEANKKLEKENEGLWAWVVDRHEMAEKLSSAVRNLKKELADEKTTGAIVWWFMLIFCAYSVIASVFYCFKAVRIAIKQSIGLTREPKAAPAAPVALKNWDDVNVWVDGLMKKHSPDDKIECPICGREVMLKNMKGHIKDVHTQARRTVSEPIDPETVPAN